MLPPRSRSVLALGCLALALLGPQATSAAPPVGPDTPPDAPAPKIDDHEAPELPESRTQHSTPLVISGSGGAQENLLGAEDPVRALFEMPASTRAVRMASSFGARTRARSSAETLASPPPIVPTSAEEAVARASFCVRVRVESSPVRS